jgi:glutamate racemase
VGPEVGIVDSAETAARAVRSALAAAGVEAAHDLCDGGPRRVRLLATDGPERFARVGGRFLGHSIEPADVELIDL